MACSPHHDHHEQNFKHFCKICKKGFGCGRALGGHMRAHGIGDESGLMDDDEDEDQISDWEDKLAETSNPASPPVNKRMYSLRTNPNRLKTCRSCENCGKEFSSWKSFLEHGKCGGESEDDAESPVSSPESESGVRRGMGWSKRKSSLRANFGNFNSSCPSSEEEDLAHCLMMLSSATVDHSYQAEPDHESCASASKDDQLNNSMMRSFVAPNRISIGIKAKSIATKGLFECKACKKVFNSHQALGGHRASHKKVKGCFAARLDDNHRPPPADEETMLNNSEDDEQQFTGIPVSKVNTPYSLQLATNSSSLTAAHHFAPSSSKRKSKVHECSICHRVFSSGQALGGHKRCHWITSNNGGQDPTLLSKFAHFDHHLASKLAQTGPIDLNLPATSDMNHRREADKQQPVTRNALSFELSAENYFLQINELKGNDEVMMMITSNQKNNNNQCHNNNVEEDDADSKVRLAKLSELKDMKVGGEGSSSSWLQVGLASSTTDNVVAIGDDNTAG
uniref:C2H2-type domain-containing protein n=1 Tax=Kalanchoe fedtschenkoi TaxID=63787 RepID=A0A7N0UYJ6_KALFE